MKTELTTRQTEIYDALAFEITRGKRAPEKLTRTRLLRIDQLGNELHRLCMELEAALRFEDDRLTTEGTSDESDNRWIKNLHRLEAMRDLLSRAVA